MVVGWSGCLWAPLQQAGNGRRQVTSPGRFWDELFLVPAVQPQSVLRPEPARQG